MQDQKTSEEDRGTDTDTTAAVPPLESSPYHYPGAEGLLAVYDVYKDWHGYLATVVCILGTVANVLNIVVLTRRNMITPTNCILTGLAVSDGLTMVVYLPFALRFYVLYGTDPTPERNSLPAVRFMLFYACFSVVVHTVSIWLTVVLAVFRYIFVKYPKHGSDLCSLGRAKVSVILVYLVTFIACIPNFVTITMKGVAVDPVVDPPPLSNRTSAAAAAAAAEVLWVVTFKVETETDRIVKSLNFWIQAILVKLVPCTGLTILSVLLVHFMKQTEARRRRLGGGPPKKAKAKAKATTKAKAKAKASPRDEDSRDRKTNRTTRMLLVVVALFLLTEFPQGILSLLSGVLSGDFVEEVYVPLGDLLDIVTLVNNGVNFILYCSMSKQFRDTFVQVFCRRCYEAGQTTSGAGASRAAPRTVVTTKL